MSIFSKVVEKALNIQLIKYLANFDIINESQYGFKFRRYPGIFLSYFSQIWTNAQKYSE